MAAGNQKLGFAIRAVNEAEQALRELKGQVNDVDEAVEQLADRPAGSGVQEMLAEIGDAAGSLEQGMRGVTDLLTVAEEKFGMNVGPLKEWTGAVAEIGGGLEGVLVGFPAFFKQLALLPGAIAPAVAAAWAHVAALGAQAVAFVVANAPILVIIGSLALLAAGVMLLVKHWDEIVEKVPWLGTAVDAVWKVVEPAFDLIVGAGEKVYGFFKDHWQLILTLISGPFLPLVMLATDMFGVRSAILGAAGEVLDFFKGVGGAGLDAWTSVQGLIESPVKAAISTIETAVGGIAGLVSGAFSGVVSTVTGILNGLIDAYNNTIGRAPGVPNIPRIGGTGAPAPPTTYGVDPGIANAAGALNGRGGITPSPNAGGALLVPSGVTFDVPGGIPGQGRNVELHVSAMDAQSFEEWLNRDGADVIESVMTRRGRFAA